MPRAISTFTLTVVAVAIAAGIALRVVHPGDIEYKGDERFTFTEVQRVLHGGAWPSAGMPMSLGTPNPPMSVWAFIALGWAIGSTTPPELARAVQLVNAAAILALAAFALVSVPREQRETWLWAAALWAINPLAVMLERKIWAQSVLPIFTVAIIAAWCHRGRWAGSFLLAVAIVLAGQIHMTGVLFGAGLVGWTALGDRRSVRWPAIAAGAALAAVPALPWLANVFRNGAGLHRLRLPFGSFYKYWIERAFGFGADFTLGPEEFRRFLGWPETGGQATWLVLGLHAAAATAGAILVVSAARQLYRSRPLSPRGILFGSTSASRIVHASFWGFGAVLTILTMFGTGLFVHYLEVIAPILALWVATLAANAPGGAIGRTGRLCLAALCVSGALIAWMLLSYVHTVGDIHGEFGRSWASQQREARLPGK